MDSNLAVTAQGSGTLVVATKSQVVSIPSLDNYKDKIMVLYQEDGCTIEKIMEILTKDGFPIGKPQLRKAMEAWGLKKYTPAAHKMHMIAKMRSREREGKATDFIYKGRPFSVEKLKRHIKDRRLDEASLQLLESHYGATPAEITYSTPGRTTGGVANRAVVAMLDAPQSGDSHPGARSPQGLPSQYSNTKEEAASMTPASVWECVPTMRTVSDPASTLKERAKQCYRKYCGNGNFNPAKMQNRADELWKSDRFEDAEEVDRLTLELSRHNFGPDHLYTLKLQGKLACTFWSQGRYAEAEELEEDVVRRSSALLREDDDDVLEYKSNLSCTYRKQGNWQKAEQLGREVLEKAVAKLGEDDQDTLVFKHNLAQTYWLMHRWNEARILLEQVVCTKERLLGPTDDSTLRSYTALATTLQNLGRWDSVAVLNNKVRSILHASNCPPPLLWTFESLSNHGHELLFLQQYTEAELVFRELVNQRTQKLSARHPDTLTSKENLLVSLYYQSKYIEAQEIGTHILQLATEVLGSQHPNTLTVKADLAWTQVSSKGIAEFESIMSEILSSRTEILGSNHPDTLASLSTKAWIYSERGNWVQAELTYREVEKIQRSIYDADEHPDLIKSLINVGDALRHREEQQEAERLLSQAFRSRALTLGENSPETLRAGCLLADLLASQSKFDEAEKLVTLLLSRYVGTFGRDHPLAVEVLATQGSLRGEQGRWPEAEIIQRKVLEYRQAHRKDDLLVSFAMWKVAECCAIQGNYDEADQLYTMALGILRKNYGPLNFYVATGLANIAWLRSEQERWQQAAELYEECLPMRRALLGDRHPTTMGTSEKLGYVYAVIGRHQASAQLYQQAYTAYTQTLGNDDPKTISAASNLARQTANQGQWMQALELYRLVLAKRTALLGPNHVDTISALGNLGEALFETGDYSAGRAYYQEALRLNTELHGPTHAETLTSAARLASCLAVLGDNEGSIKLYRDVLEQQVRDPKVGHTAIVSTKFSLAAVLNNASFYAEAEQLYLEVLEWRKANLGSSHELTAASAKELAQVAISQDRYKTAELWYIEALEMIRRNDVFSPEEISILVRYSRDQRDQGQYLMAETLSNKALALALEHLGPNHPSTHEAEISLGYSLNSLNKYAEAEVLLRKAMEVTKRNKGENSPAAVYLQACLGLVLSRDSRHLEAEEMLNAVLCSLERSGNLVNAWTKYNALRVLANIKSEMGKYGEAVELQRRALGLRKDSLSIALDLGRLGDYLRSAKRLAEAEEVEERALDLWRSLSDCSSAGFIRQLQDLGQTKCRLGKFAEAEALLIECVAAREKLDGQPPLALAASISLLSIIEISLAKYHKAEAIQRRVVQIFKAVCGEESMYYLTGLFILTLCMVDSDKLSERHELQVRVAGGFKVIRGEQSEEYSIATRELAITESMLSHFTEAEADLPK